MPWPLPLTPFEEYMLCDDRPAHPMTGFFRVRFSGLLEREHLESALRTAISRHPLTRSKVIQEGGRFSWVPDEDFSPTLESFSATPDREYPLAGHLDLLKGAGTRCWLVDRNGAHDLVVQMHHTATDALGMCRFIEDVLLEYARLTGTAGPNASLRPLSDERLARRNDFGLTWGRFLRMLPRQAIGLLGARQALMRKPSRLLPEQSPQPSGADFPSPRTVDFSPDETQAILATAKRLGCTVNDLLARELFLAVGEFRRRHGAESSQDWLRFSVPMNLRGPQDEQLGVANVVSMIFLDRRPAQLRDEPLLLRTIQDEMQLIKRNKLSWTFVLSLAVARRLPGGMRRMARREGCWATAIFSNMGVILTEIPLPRKDGKIAVGDVTVEGLDFVTPLRPHTAAACCVYTYAGRLFVMLHCDPRTITREMSRELMNLYLERIRGSIRASGSDGAPGRSPPAPRTSSRPLENQVAETPTT